MFIACRRSLASIVLSLSCAAGSALSVRAQVLDLNTGTLTTYAAADKSLIGNLRPRVEQRLSDIDGSPRAMMPYGMAIAADTLGGGYSGGRKLGDVDLSTGTYSPTEIDLALPSLGMPVIIGRTYNNRQIDSSGNRYDSDGIQGTNWGQLALPELVKSADGNTLYIVGGADRYAEFVRIGSTDDFKAKNGAAGVITFTAGSASYPDVYSYNDPLGNEMAFFGFNSGAGNAKGQFWRANSPDSTQAVYSVHPSDAGVALTYGYDGTTGRLSNLFDGSGRKYIFAYDTFGGKDRLKSVTVQLSSSNTTLIAKVEYDYYTAPDSGKGDVGDLKTVTITRPVSTSSNQVLTKYYRYYTAGGSSTLRGIKCAVGFEAVRAQTLTTIAGMGDSSLKAYSDFWFEYDSNQQISSALFNGQCGCSGGGANGTHTITYATSSGTFTSGYDQNWKYRATVGQPDGNYAVQYFDEAGQALGRVVANNVPASASKVWATDIQRDTSGRVTDIYSPAAVSGYNASSDSFTRAGSGLVTSFGRYSGTDTKLTGLKISTSVKPNGGSATTISDVSISSLSRNVGSTSVPMVVVDGSSTHPDSSTTLTTTMSYTYQSSTNTDPGYVVPKTTTVTQPAVSTGNNGPGGSGVQTVSYHRPDGSIAFSKDPTSVFMYSGRDAFGRRTKSIADADPGSSDINTEDDPSAWSLSASGTPIHALTTTSYDNYSRVTTVKSPSANGNRLAKFRYVVNSDGSLGTFSFPHSSVSGTTTTLYGPASYVETNHNGKPVVQGTYAVGSSGTTSTPSTTINSTSWANVVTTQYDASGTRVNSTKQYTSLSSYPSGGFDTTSYDYDAMGRRNRVVDPTGTIRRTTFDERGMSSASFVGTNDNSSSGMGGTDNMVKTGSLEYDNGASGGNGWLTKRIQDEDGNWSTTGDQRVMQTIYDYRGRVVATINAVAPHVANAYDDLGRVLAVGQYSSISPSSPPNPATDNSNRLTLNETVYDERGQVARSTRWEINQSTGATGGSIVTNNWYDSRGLLIKSTGPQFSKRQYDRLGRGVANFLLATLNDTGYSDAANCTGDTVIEETWTGMDPKSGHPLVQFTVQRNHNDDVGGTTGPLFTGSDPLTIGSGSLAGRAQISATWYDDHDRAIESVAVGTNGGSTFTRSSMSVPARSGTALRTSYAFDDFGRTYQVTDTNGIVNKTEFDAASRKTRTIDNYVDGTPGKASLSSGQSDDEDRVTEYTYSNGLTATVTRKMRSTSDDQVTEYDYDTANVSGSWFSAKNVLVRVTLPPQSGSQAAADRRIEYTYNALGQVKTTKDPEGNVITTSYDAGGRQVAREAAPVSGFDTRVKKITTSYNNRGMTETVTNKDASNATLDSFTFTYDGWGNIFTTVQDPVVRASFTTTYEWETKSDGWLGRRLVSVTQPGGAVLEIGYDSSVNAISEKINRPTNTFDPNGPLAEYKYLGARTAVSVALPEPNAANRAYNGSNAYTDNLDNFNRPKKLTWKREISGTGITAPVFVDMAMEYNQYSQVTKLNDNVFADGTTTEVKQFERVFSYDSLRRLYQLDEGEAGTSSITTQSRQEIIPRGLSGKIGLDQVDLNGNGSFLNGPPNSMAFGEMDDTRSYNKRNELVSRSVKDSSNTSTPKSVTLTYDKNGNLKNDGEKYKYTFDVWCHLVEVRDQADVLQARFTYNALGYRATEQLDTMDPDGTKVPGDGVVDSNDPTFYIAHDLQGRRLATFRETDTYAKETYFHHPDSVKGPAFVGGPIVRDRNESCMYYQSYKYAANEADSTRSERYYYVPDAGGNIVALVTAGGALAEQYRYSATGVPYGIPLGDTTGKGYVSSTTTSSKDYQQTKYIQDYKSTNGYKVRGDLNLDGKLDGDDLAIVSAKDGNGLGKGVSSALAIFNPASGKFRDYYGAIGASMAANKFFSDILNLQIESPASTCVSQDDNVVSGKCNGVSCYSDTIMSVVVNQPLTPTAPAPAPVPVPAPLPWWCPPPGSGWYTPGEVTCSAMLLAAKGICYANNPGGGFGLFSCLELANAAYEACLATVYILTDEQIVKSCLSVPGGVLPASPWVCNWYPPLWQHGAHNFRCMCLCNGNSPWAQRMRYCIQCSIANGATPTNAHALCGAALLSRMTSLDALIFANCALRVCPPAFPIESYPPPGVPRPAWPPTAPAPVPAPAPKPGSPSSPSPAPSPAQ